MQYTSNYNLITVEGTDVVNPLVQMNPNFTDIDAAMFANKQATIGTATELTAGTVHSITRTNPDSNYFRFTATSNWTAGDTMNVDGVSVSVYLTDGTTPGTGSYVINSEVLAMISGSRVTLFVSTSPINSLDADQITFDPTGTGLNPADTDVDKAIKDLDGMINKGSITVTSDGVKTLGQILTELFNSIDSSKINANSYLKVSNAAIYHLCLAGTYYSFGSIYSRYVETYNAGSTSSASTFDMASGTYTDNTTYVYAAGVPFTLTY